MTYHIITFPNKDSFVLKECQIKLCLYCRKTYVKGYSITFLSERTHLSEITDDLDYEGTCACIDCYKKEIQIKRRKTTLKELKQILMVERL